MQAASPATERMQSLLATLFPQAQSAPAITPLAADASTRRYFRVHWPEGASMDPASCVMMVCTPWAATETPDFLTVGQHLRACGVSVPEVYGVAPGDGLMCLEDYGDRTLAAQWQDRHTTYRLAWGYRAIDELIKIHTTATQRHAPACPAFQLAFDVPKLLSELQFFRQHALEGLWQCCLSDDARAELDGAFETLCTLLASQPRYFCHRDYHGWNIMAHNNTAGVLDFQDARMGPQPYDLVSLLTDRGTPQLLGHTMLQEFIDYYIRQFDAATGQHMDGTAFAELFDYVAVQRCLKATGTFAMMHMAHQRSQYLSYIAPTLAYLQPLLQRYATLHPLLTLLSRYIPQL